MWFGDISIANVRAVFQGLGARSAQVQNVFPTRDVIKQRKMLFSKGRAYPIFVRLWRRIGEPISNLVALFRYDLAVE